MASVDRRSKHKRLYTITIHRIEGVRALSDNDVMCIVWTRGSRLSGRSKEALVCDELITWEETFSVPVSLSKVQGSDKHAKKCLKFALRQAGSNERIAEVEIDLARYMGGCEAGSVPLTMREKEKRRAGDVQPTLVLSVESKPANGADTLDDDDEGPVLITSPSVITPLPGANEAPEELHRLSKTVLSALVDSLEDGHPEWTSRDGFHHPDLVAMITEEVESGLEEALTASDETGPLSRMTRPELETHFGQLIQLLNSSDMILAMGLLAIQLDDEQATEEAAGGLVGFYDDRKTSHVLLRAAVLYEIRIRGPSLDIFSEAQSEGCCTPSVILAFYIEALSSSYLIDLLAPAVEFALSLDGQLDLDNPESEQRAVANMTHCLRKVVTCICNSPVHEAPAFFRYISFLIHQTVVQLHPRQCKQVLCSFIMRRLFCPLLLDPERLTEGEEDPQPFSKQVTNVFKIAAKCLEAMAACEQLRTRESWVPEVNSVIREHMQGLDSFVEDLVYSTPDGYNTQIEHIEDSLDLSLSLELMNNLAINFKSEISRNMALIVMSQEYLTGSQEAQERYLAECDTYSENNSEYAFEGDMVGMAPIELDSKEVSSLKSAVQAAQVYKKGLSNIMKNIADWRLRDPGSRHLYSQIQEDILASQEANRAVLAQLGQLQLHFDSDSDYNTTLQSTDRSTYNGSRPGTPVTDREIMTDRGEVTDRDGPRPLTPINTGRSATPLGGSPIVRPASRPGTPVQNRQTPVGTPVQVIEAVVDARTHLNDLIAVVNSVAELYDIMRFSRMDTLLDADPSLTTERASEQSNSRLDHVIAQSRRLSSFEVGFANAIVVGNSLLEIVGDTSDVMQQVNNMRAALEAKRTSALEEAGMTPPAAVDKPETPRDETPPKTRLRRLSIGVANFVMQLSTDSGQLTARGDELQGLYREPISVKDRPPSEQDVERCLNLLRDAHNLWRQLGKSSMDVLAKREGFKHLPVERQLQVSTTEIDSLKAAIAELKRQWDTQLSTGLPAVGYNLCFELLAENSVLRLDVNLQTQELHRSTLERLRTLEQYTTTTNASPDDADTKNIGQKLAGFFSF